MENTCQDNLLITPDMRDDNEKNVKGLWLSEYMDKDYLKCSKFGTVI